MSDKKPEVAKGPPTSTFCALPWVHLNTQPDGSIYHCCLADLTKPLGNVKEDTLEEVWNSKPMTAIRRQMLNDRKPRACKRCYNTESTGINSPRQSVNNVFKDSITTLANNTDPMTGVNEDFTLKYWDFRWSNICNFKCRMCGVFSSSKWAEDEAAITGEVTPTGKGGIIAHRKESKVDIMNYVDRFIMDVEEVYFAGGEPLIMDEHYIILEKLIAAGRTDVRLRYNSNFSHLKFKKWDLMGLWQPFLDDPRGSVKITASLDAIGKLAEVARNGTKWNQVEQNIKMCVEQGLDIYFAPTISILNVFYVHELVDLAIKNNIPASSLSFNNVLVDPKHYDIRLLPDNLKEDLMDKLQGYIDKCKEPKYKQVLQYGYSAWKTHMNSTAPFSIRPMEQKLVRDTEILDERRKENFLEVNPQYVDWFNEIKKPSPEYI